MASEPYVELKDCPANDRSVNGVLLANNAVLHYKRPGASRKKDKLVKEKKTGETPTGRNLPDKLPDGAMYMPPTSSILRSGIVAKRGKSRKDKPGADLGKKKTE